MMGWPCLQLRSSIMRESLLTGITEWHTWAREHISTCLALSTSICRDASLSVSPDLAGACFLCKLLCTTGAATRMAHPFLHAVFAAGMCSIVLSLCLKLHTRCRIAGAFGWAATLDIMLLFFPVPRSTFLHWLLGSSFPALIKYHRLTALTFHTSSDLADFLLDVVINLSRSAIPDCSTPNACIKNAEAKAS